MKIVHYLLLNDEEYAFPENIAEARKLYHMFVEDGISPDSITYECWREVGSEKNSLIVLSPVQTRALFS